MIGRGIVDDDHFVGKLPVGFEPGFVAPFLLFKFVAHNLVEMVLFIDLVQRSFEIFVSLPYLFRCCLQRGFF